MRDGRWVSLAPLVVRAASDKVEQLDLLGGSRAPAAWTEARRSCQGQVAWPRIESGFAQSHHEKKD